nr:hypothetical protein [Tanacetum cinerariifolium]
MTMGNKKQYIIDVRVMNYLLQAIPNNIYNLVDACKNAKEMWQIIKRLMFGLEVTSHVRHPQLKDEFDKFILKEGESLESVYERLIMLVNIMDRNTIRPILVSINTKFLNYLQPEWSKYVTIVRHNQMGDNVSYDVLYDSLVQFEPHVLASKAKKAAKNHDPLALIAYSNAPSSQSHGNSSYSPQPYYVTFPSLVVNYDDEYQGELQREEQMLFAMKDEAGSNLTNEENDFMLDASYGEDTLEELTDVVMLMDRLQPADDNAENVPSYDAKAVSEKLKVCDAKYFREQMLFAMKDEAGSNLTNEENDFMLDASYGEDTLEELTDVVMLMDRLQPADDNAENVPSYDAKAVSEVNASSKVHKQVSHVKCKIIIQITYDDHFASSIIFDDPFVENNGGTSRHDSNAHDEYHDIQMLAYDIQRETENQKYLNDELRKQNVLLQQKLETCKDRVKTFESKIIQCLKYKETFEELKRELRTVKNTIERIMKEKDQIRSDFFKTKNEKILIQHETQLAKKTFKERENWYLEDIVVLEEKLSSHDRIVYKMSQSIQMIHMLGKKLNKVYDHFLKAGLGYQNPKRLKKAIATQPKLYNDDLLQSANFIIDLPNSEETLEDAKESH